MCCVFLNAVCDIKVKNCVSILGSNKLPAKHTVRPDMWQEAVPCVQTGLMYHTIDSINVKFNIIFLCRQLLNWPNITGQS